MPSAVAPWGDASDILSRARTHDDPGYHQEFARDDEKAVLTVPMRIQEAWERNDADMFADLFVENGSLLMQDVQLNGREAIRRFMSDGFGGPFRGARVRGAPLAVEFLDADVALVVSQGGIVLAGETSTAPDRRVRIIWTVVRQDGEPRLLAHQSSPIGR